ncbi:MAG TPA: hypothetical protein VIW25_11535 [Nitrososphaeraceae archaeon]
MGFHKGRSIIDAGTFKARQVFQWRPSILSPVAITIMHAGIRAPFST